MGKSIVVTSGKGGVGKTTVTANLGLALAAKERRTALVEADIGLNNLDVILRIENKVVYDIGDVLSNKCSIVDSLIAVSEYLYVLPAATVTSERVSAHQFAGVVEDLKTVFDYVIIDCPAGIEDSFHRAVSAGEEGIIVTTPHLADIRDAHKVAKVLQSYHLKGTGLIVNRIRGDYVADGLMADGGEIAKVLKLPLYGVIPEDDYLNLYGLADAEDRKSPSAYSYALLADYLDGGDKKIFDCVTPYKGILQKIKRRLR